MDASVHRGLGCILAESRRFVKGGAAVHFTLDEAMALRYRTGAVIKPVVRCATGFALPSRRQSGILSPKKISSWACILPQSLRLPVHFRVMSIAAR